jgi:hypothetical protein
MNCPNCGAPTVGECEYCNTIVPLAQNEDSDASPINVTNANKYNININGNDNNVNISNDTYVTIVNGNDNLIEAPVAARSRVYPNGNEHAGNGSSWGWIAPLILLMVIVMVFDPLGGLAFFGSIGVLVASVCGIVFLVKRFPMVFKAGFAILCILVFIFILVACYKGYRESRRTMDDGINPEALKNQTPHYKP